VNKYRDKSEFFELPEIPESFDTLFYSLINDLQHTSEPATRKLVKIYMFLESYGKFVSSFSVCKRGCSYCCHIPVSITELEALFISEGIKRKFRNTASHPIVSNTSPCPFLSKTGECGIYEIRPFHCRTFNVLDDPKYCKSGEDHNIYGSSKGQYTVTFYTQLNEIINILNYNHSSFDIRNYFG
jgi:Fe-S-cluster containining protein